MTRPRTAVALAAAVAAGVLLRAAAAPKGQRSDAVGVVLGRHSFERTLTYDDSLGDWLSSAATMAMRDRVQLMPAVVDRQALFWSKRDITTRYFEVTFTLSGRVNEDAKVNLPMSGDPSDGMLAFWVSLDNFSATFDEQAVITAGSGWNEGMKAAGLTFIGNKPTFRGLAMVFGAEGASSKGSQSVTGIWSDGSTPVPEGQVPVDGADSMKQTKYLDWLSGATQVKVRVGPRGIVGSVMTLDLGKHFAGTIWGWADDGETVDHDLTFELDHSVKSSKGPKGHWDVVAGNRIKIEIDQNTYVMRVEGSHRAVLESSEKAASEWSVMYYGGQAHSDDQDEWTEVFRFPGGKLPQDAKSLYIGFSGSTGSKAWIEVDLHHLQTLNYDPRSAGEDNQDVFAAGDATRWREVMEREKRFVDQASQKDAVLKLTELLSGHVKEYERLGDKLKSELGVLDGRVDALAGDLGNYLSAMRSFSVDQNKFSPEALKAHITGIKTMLSNHDEQHSRKLQEVNKAAQELKAVQSTGGQQKVASVAEQSKAVEQFAAKGSVQMDSLLVAIVVVVGGLGLLFFNRMRYYEKKHVI